MNTDEPIRLDKWLWAARFFKTRSLATKAITGGKVYYNGQRVKPSKLISTGDMIRIQRNFFEFTIKVLGVNDKRRSATEAGKLYIETDESIIKREEIINQRRLHNISMPNHKTSGRPSKRDRRLIKSFIGND